MFSTGPALIVSDQVPPFDSDQTSAVVSRYPLIQDGDGTFFIDANTCPSAKIRQEINGIPTKVKVRFLGAGCRSFSDAQPLTDGQRFALNIQTQGNTDMVDVDGIFDDVDDSRPTYFADVTLTKEWQRWTGEAKK